MTKRRNILMWALMVVILLAGAASFSSCEKITDDDYDTLHTPYRTNGGGNIIRY